MEIRELIRPFAQCAIGNHNTFAENMALKNGLPLPERVRLDQPLPVAKAIVEPVREVAQSMPALQVAAPVAQSLLSRALPWVAAGALSLGTGGLGAGLASYFLSRPSPQVAAPVVEAETGLLSDLQERGFHLPPAGAIR